MKKILACLLAFMTFVPSCTPQTPSVTASFPATTPSDAVSLEEAQLVAAYWAPTGLEHSFTGPTLYLNFDMSPAAYEFTYLREGKSAGWVMVAARKDWSPILESSDGAAYSSLVPEALQVAVSKGYVAPGENPLPVFFYCGALSGYVQFGEKMKAERAAIEPGWGFEIVHLPDKPVKLSFNTFNARSSWMRILADAGG